VQEAASLAFPNTKLANNIQIPALGGPAPPPAGTTPPSAAAAAGSNHCATLQSDITGTLRTPISFLTGGSELTADSRQELAQVAGKIEACPAVSVSVVGYTDNVGSAAANLSLSASRAKSVAALLVSDGVPIDHVTSRGAGSANPVGSNDTPTGRAQNRRVEITTH
jgi:peptidoglycan-binding protein ArfA